MAKGGKDDPAGGRVEKIEKQHKQGKLTGRERMAAQGMLIIVHGG
jgi:hypothetical protein